jgi:hypothetical protein
LLVVADERRALWAKVHDLTQACLGWEDSAVDYEKVAAHFRKRGGECHLLTMQSAAAAGDLAAARAQLAEKEHEVAVTAAERAAFQAKAADAASALEQHTATLDMMQVLSAAKLRAVESKYVTPPPPLLRAADW